MEKFILRIDNVFSITGRGTVVAGHVKSGIISVNDTVIVNERRYVVTGIESNQKIVEYASKGMAIGMLLRGATPNDFVTGDIVTKVGEEHLDTSSVLDALKNEGTICKSCGGNLMKDGNVFVCERCGEVFKDENAVKNGNTTIRTKAKKTTESFSAEKTERLNNLYNVARRAKENNNDEQAEKYYDMILIEDPNSWEAVYYTTYFNVAQSKIGQISSAADKLANCLNSVFELIEEYVPSGEEASAVSEVFTKTKAFAELLYFNARNHYSQFKDTSNAVSEFLTRCNSVYLLLCELGDQLEKRFISNPAIGNMCAEAWKKGIEIRLNYRFWDEASKQKILSYSDKVKKYDPSYQGVTFNNGGCYVATCVYGSYDCPEVWTLRRYRDYELDTSWYGRAFIKTYYAISPTIVKWFGNAEWFKKLWKNKLDKIVKKLNDIGYDNTKYIDKY